MTTAGDPAAPTAIEPRTPAPYRAVGAVAFGVAALSIIGLAVQIGSTPHSPITPIILSLALGISVGTHVGMWCAQQDRLAALDRKIDDLCVAVRHSSAPEVDQAAYAKAYVDLVRQRGELDPGALRSVPWRSGG